MRLEPFALFMRCKLFNCSWNCHAQRNARRNMNVICSSTQVQASKVFTCPGILNRTLFYFFVNEM